jgi:site-specific DNA-methyltransferase (adenine-specific)
MLRYEWIWEKTAATGHLNAKKMPMKAHENVLVFYSNLPTYNPIHTHGHKRKTTKLVRHSSDIYGDQKGTTSYNSTSRYPRSVLKFSSDKQKNNLHPTQKPNELGEYFVKTYSNEGDLIVDTCMGSGALVIPAVKLGRKVIGMDNGKCEKKSSKYFGWNWNDVVNDRLRCEYGEL